MTVAKGRPSRRIRVVPVSRSCCAVDHRERAFIEFCVAAATDLIDGTVARLMKQSSRWGAILDPMADKLMFFSAFICMVIVGVVPLWFFILALTRDLVITTGIMYLKINKIPHPQFAITSSKFATFLQMGVAVTGLLMYWNPRGAFDQYFGAQVPFLVLATSCIIISGVQYVCRGLEILKNYHPGSANS